MYNNEIKRGVQSLLFSTVNKDSNLGFVGLTDFDDDWKSYVDLVNSHIDCKNQFFINREKIYYKVLNRKKPLNKGYDIVKFKPEKIMDCDFCDTIKNSGNRLLSVYDRMKKYYIGKEKYLLFTFSLRAIGKNKTLNWLNKELFDNTLMVEFDTECIINKKLGYYLKEIHHSQFKFNNSKLYSYKNGGSPMITGIVSWN